MQFKRKVSHFMGYMYRNGLKKKLQKGEILLWMDQQDLRMKLTDKFFVCVGFSVTRLWAGAPLRTRSCLHTWRIFLSVQTRWPMKSVHLLGTWGPLLASLICSQQFQSKWLQKWWRWVCLSLAGVWGSYLFTSQDLWSRKITLPHCSFFSLISRAMP